jgi:hypothetical protein
LCFWFWKQTNKNKQTKMHSRNRKISAKPPTTS